MNNEPVVLTRQQLYEKIWSQPVWTLAKEWGISDVGLAKICKGTIFPGPVSGIGPEKNTVTIRDRHRFPREAARI